ncbi:saccharopine dehydrogenase-like oxidoreductase [Pseudomyrmex gracilis]|uniref:saccharopine dehydrogenase-like oxidoreductase n=1 Tax=Pseudomyrmex gracilis TaxID=219809 RepID=UPI0009957DDF|nr:saccharopine dehydrogenase-like oxidoreductase [Pseudomyrmex gracilis]
MANERLDLVIFGATGFTGKYAVKQAIRFCKEYRMKFGIAGRRKEGLEAVLKELKTEDNPLDDVPLILADVKDEESLKTMTKQAKVIVNCCGPYRFYGEPVVKACVATRTHHVDISGEPQYMERMQLEYNKAAQEAGVYIVSACGFDSIPTDLGVIFAQEKFDGEVNSVETYLTASGDGSGSSLNYGTWESAVYGLAHANELRELRTKLYPIKLPKFMPPLKSKGLLHCSDVSRGYSVPFLGSDRSVVQRTQRFLYEKYKQRPAQIQTYVTFQSLLVVVGLAIIGGLFSIMSRTSFGRKLLLRYPALFSCGYVTREGPNPESLERTRFSVTCKALGWTEKLTEPTFEHTDPPNKKVIIKVSGVNPGYGATTIMLVLSAITILKEADKMPDNGGVLPPGAAFSKTSLIEQLNKNDVKFEVLSSTEI